MRQIERVAAIALGGFAAAALGCPVFLALGGSADTPVGDLLMQAWLLLPPALIAALVYWLITWMSRSRPSLGALAIIALAAITAVRLLFLLAPAIFYLAFGEPLVSVAVYVMVCAASVLVTVVILAVGLGARLLRQAKPAR